MLHRYRVAAATPSSGSLRLSVLDLVPRLVPLSFVHFFDARLDGEALARSLAQTLSSFPCLTGKMVRDGDGYRVDHSVDGAVSFVVATQDGPMPRPGPREGAKPYFSRLVDAIPPWRLALRGGPLFRARLTRYADGSVLGVSLSHALGDMHSYCLLLQHWAALHRGEPAPAPCHDRSLVERGAAAVAGVDVGAHFVRLSPFGRVRNAARFAGGYFDSTTTTVRISGDELSALKLEAQGGQDARLSTHDALSAHLWRKIGGLRRLGEAHPSTLTSIVNLRRYAHAGLPESYFGNATLAVPASLPHGEVMESSLSRRALAVRAATQRLDRPRLATVTAFLAQRRRERDFEAVFPRMGIFENDLWINNWSRFPLYDLDFGAGRPFWFDLPRLPLPWFAVVAPAASSAGGVDVHLSLPRRLSR